MYDDIGTRNGAVYISGCVGSHYRREKTLIVRCTLHARGCFDRAAEGERVKARNAAGIA